MGFPDQGLLGVDAWFHALLHLLELRSRFLDGFKIPC